MTSGSVEAPRPGAAPPGVLRAAERLPGSPWVLGVGLALGLLLLELGATLATPPPERLPFAAFRALALPLLSGYVVVATCGLAASGRRTLRTLAPQLRPEAPPPEALARLLCELPRAVHGACAAVAVIVPLAVGAALPELRRAVAAAHPETLAFWAMASLFWWLLAQAVALVLIQAHGMRVIGLRLVRVDLFRPGALAPFGRFAVQSALYVCGGLALAVLLAATPGSEGSWLPRLEIARGVGALAAVLAASGACAFAALALPLLGIRRHIREEKARVVQRVEDALPHHAAEAEAVLRGGSPRAAGLLALRDRVQASPEWPLDGDTRRRFGLYALLPATSWVAKALVERGVEWILG